MTVALISHPDCLDHQMGGHHPEAPERLHAIQDRLVASGLEFLLRQFDAPRASYDQLARVHQPDYLQMLERNAPTTDSGVNWLDGDTGMTSHTLPAALRSAGSGVLAVDLLMKGEADAAFCATRPPGHHAGKASASGFCFYNNVAIAATHALEEHGLQRVAIIDFDVHHGNGTEEIVSGDSRILFCSSFQHPFYPFSGAGDTADNILNLPLPGSTEGEDWRSAVEQAWLPKIEAFRPQLVFISAGFDGHAEDDMSHFRLREPDYAWLTRELKRIADQHAEGRMISMLEGGYDLSSLGRSVSAHIDELIGHT